jgi:hypothetical protein
VLDLAVNISDMEEVRRLRDEIYFRLLDGIHELPKLLGLDLV